MKVSSAARAAAAEVAEASQVAQQDKQAAVPQLVVARLARRAARPVAVLQVRWVVLRAVAVRKAVQQGRGGVPQAEALRARWAEAPRAAVRPELPRARGVVPRAVGRLAAGPLAGGGWALK